MDPLEAVGLAMAVMFVSWLVIMSRLDRSTRPKAPRLEYFPSHPPIYVESNSMEKSQREWRLDQIALVLWIVFFAALMVFLPR